MKNFQVIFQIPQELENWNFHITDGREMAALGNQN